LNGPLFGEVMVFPGKAFAFSDLHARRKSKLVVEFKTDRVGSCRRMKAGLISKFWMILVVVYFIGPRQGFYIARAGIA